MDQSGLTWKEVDTLQQRYGKNEITKNNKGRIRQRVKHILSEPIYVLLAFSAVIYFILGESVEGAVMIAFVILVIGIDVLQDVRTGNTLSKLREITSPKVRVIREGTEFLISSTELVPGDVIRITEGMKIPADGYLVEANGLCIDESILTGESVGILKYAITSRHEEAMHDTFFYQRNYCYSGTCVILGSGILIVDKIGDHTEYGKIAEELKKESFENSLLQKQMRRLAKQCTIFASVLFILVGLATFYNLTEGAIMERIIHSALAGIVLALSMVPGEFPVIMTVFFSMGALRLARKNTLIRHLPSVETLGAISALCMDKTGTITQNKMQVSDCYINRQSGGRFCKALAMACKTGTCDPLEKALLDFGDQLCYQCKEKETGLKACNIIENKPVLIKEYPFTNELKAMGQVWQEENHFVIVAKGSPETILSLCNLYKDLESEVKNVIRKFTGRGLRVIAVADRTTSNMEDIPENLLECQLFLRGIIGLNDPPRDNIKRDIGVCKKAGIRIIMITGDHPNTASEIAKQVGITSELKVMTGDELSKLKDMELREKVRECNIYARVLPLHKMRIVKALKENGYVVAMTGDGVNDSPAQRMADIGIAMGKDGNEVCREAADVILLDDNFPTVLGAIEDGRRIYQNIIKAICYVLTIHIPIALISFVVPLLKISPDSLMLLPLHIVLLELVMNPTCSITLERLPAEETIMNKPPRNINERLLSPSRFMRCILQGIIIFIASFGLFYYLLKNGASPEVARTSGFTVLVLSNIFLVSVNSSDTESIIRTLLNTRKDKVIWVVNFIIVLSLCVMVYSPINQYLRLAPLPPRYVFYVLVIALLAVIWYEIYKLMKRVLIKYFI
jgi:Ca2+-transporting ATPase